MSLSTLIATVCSVHLSHNSVYIHCKQLWHGFPRLANRRGLGGLTNPAPGVLDFDDWRALQPMFDAAKQAGLFIVFRPGELFCREVHVYFSQCLFGIL